MSYYIFGAGEVGKRALEYYGEKNIEGFVDNSSSKIGNIFCQRNVISFDEFLRQKEKKIVIAVNPIYRKSIQKQLEDRDIRDYKIFFDSVVNCDEIFLDGFRENDCENEEDWNKNLSEDLFVKRYVENSSGTELFCEIEIETINRCNGRCSFCPVNIYNDSRKKQIMSQELFEKIVSELENLNYKGRISVFSNNEPLLDEHIIDRYMYVKKKLPNAFVHIYTNGKLLDLRKFISLIDIVDEFVIDNYSANKECPQRLLDIADYIKNHDEIRHKVIIWNRNENEVLSSRGGDAPNRNNIKDFGGTTCMLPFQQLVIRPDGGASLCCNDPFGKMTLGNVNKNTLLEVWFGEAYKQIREKIANGRMNIDKCKSCDTFIYF